jgi:hypothetical protein
MADVTTSPTPGAAPATLPASPTPRGWRSSLRRFLLFMSLAVFVGGPLLLTLYILGALKFSYSDGERAGYVQKFSRKGWVCKTWEGELAMVSLPGAMPEIFRFTVRDEAVAKALNASMGQRVALHYEQHVGLPTSCFGETDHFVVGVRSVVEPLPLTPPVRLPSPPPGTSVL